MSSSRLLRYHFRVAGTVSINAGSSSATKAAAAAAWGAKLGKGSARGGLQGWVWTEAGSSTFSSTAMKHSQKKNVEEVS